MKLTIFTPTYNRKSELAGLFDSICASYKSLSANHSMDFIEWLIVDDGSTTEISDDIEIFKKSADFPVIFIKKENGGKHTAFNCAIEYTGADLFVCVDDDDRLTDNALKDIFALAEEYWDNKGELKYGAIVGRVVDEQNRLKGRNLSHMPIVSNTLEIRDKYRFWGEPEVYCVNKLKEFRFKVFESERFLTEAYLFDDMSTKYPFIYTNYAFMIKKYLDGGLTSNQLKIRIESPNGAEAYYYKRKFLCKGVFPKLKATINRQRFQYWSKKKDNREKDIYELIARPISFFMWIRDKNQYKG